MALNNDVNSLLQKYHQEHLLRFHDRNTDEQNQQLLADINVVDFQSLCREEYFKNSDHLKSIENLEPLDANIQQDIRQTSPENIEKYRQLGKLLSN